MLNVESITGIINDFWQLKTKISNDYIVKFNRLLPYASDIIGDIKLTSECLEYVLNEKVGIQVDRSRGNEIFLNEDNNTFYLNESNIGQNTILGTTVNEGLDLVRIEIGPLKNTLISDYFETGKLKSIISYFIEYFFQLELEIEFTIKIEGADNDFVLNEELESSPSYLGYNTAI
jgi:predicted component of type VI protein secretion system